MKKYGNLPASLFEHTLWEKTVHPIWIASNFVIHRNLAGYPFPHKLSEKQKEQLMGFLKKPFLASSSLTYPTFLSSDTLDKTEKEYLYEHFLVENPCENSFKNQGFIVDDTASFLATFNHQNHLFIQCVDTTSNWNQTWNQLSQIEEEISKNHEFAFHPKFGFLSSNPPLCGTGFTLSVYLHLPALIHLGELEEALIKEKDQEIQFKGLSGKETPLIGDMIIFQNKYCMGTTEEHILQSMQKTMGRFIHLETILRARLRKEPNPTIKDKISRAFGILNHSYQIEVDEALDILSLIKLGMDLEWIKGGSIGKINEVFFNCRRSHLILKKYLASNPSDISQTDLPHQRAEYLKKTLSTLSLNVPEQ